MKIIINILLLFTLVGCNQNIKKENIIEKPIEEKTITSEIPYHNFIDMLLARMDSTEISTHKIVLDTIPDKATKDRSELLEWNGLSLQEKELLKQALQQPDLAKWQVNKVNAKSKRILDSTTKETNDIITIYLASVSTAKDLNNVCCMVYTLYQHEKHESIKGGGLDIVYFSKKQNNTWHIEKLINVEEY